MCTLANLQTITFNIIYALVKIPVYNFAVLSENIPMTFIENLHMIFTK